MIQTGFEITNFNILPPNGNIGSLTSSFFDFNYLQTLSACIANISFKMPGTFIRSRDPFNMLVDSVFVDVDYSN